MSRRYCNCGCNKVSGAFHGLNKYGKRKVMVEVQKTSTKLENYDFWKQGALLSTNAFVVWEGDLCKVGSAKHVCKRVTKIRVQRSDNIRCEMCGKMINLNLSIPNYIIKGEVQCKKITV